MGRVAARRTRPTLVYPTCGDLTDERCSVELPEGVQHPGARTILRVNRGGGAPNDAVRHLDKRCRHIDK